MAVTNRRGDVGAVLFRTSNSNQLEFSPETQVKESLELAEPTPAVDLAEAVRQIYPPDDLPPGFYYIHPDEPDSEAISGC